MAQPGDIIEHPITGERVTFLRTTAETGGEYVQAELAVAPGGFVSLAHIHPRQEERFTVKSGALTIIVDGKTSRLGPGESIRIAAGTPHEWRNADPVEMVAIVEFFPALSAEECFESAFGLAQDGKVDPVSGIMEQPWLALLLVTYRDFIAPVDPPQAILLEQLRPIADEAIRQGFNLPYPYPHHRLAEETRASA